MGWVGLIGEFAKDLAEGYVEQRGVKGTIDDISGLVSSFSKDDNDDVSQLTDDNDDVAIQRWKNLADQLNNDIGKGNYAKANERLNNYYERYEDSEVDVYYYSWRAEILVGWLESIVGEEDFEELDSVALEAIEEGMKMADNEELRDDFKSLLNRIIQANDQHNNIISKRNVKGDKIEVVPSVSVSVFTDEEQEYINEVKACLEDDGAITERERRLLDRLRRSLGISEERGKELESQCQPFAFTAEEQEYADELKNCFEYDGEITEREHRLLDKLRMSLNISEERAMEIETIVNNNK